MSEVITTIEQVLANQQVILERLSSMDSSLSDMKEIVDGTEGKVFDLWERIGDENDIPEVSGDDKLAIARKLLVDLSDQFYQWVAYRDWSNDESTRRVLDEVSVFLKTHEE